MTLEVTRFYPDPNSPDGIMTKKDRVMEDEELHIYRDRKNGSEGVLFRGEKVGGSFWPILPNGQRGKEFKQEIVGRDNSYFYDPHTGDIYPSKPDREPVKSRVKLFIVGARP